MKKWLVASLVCLSSIGFVACNGDYDADPTTNNSGTGNPIKPGGGGSGGGSSFNWSGTDPMSAKIDGVEWTPEVTDFYEEDGFLQVNGSKGTAILGFAIKASAIEAGKIYDFNATNQDYIASYAEDAFDVNKIFSGNLGGGQIKILEKDANHIKALFYFTGKNSVKSVNITEGYVNLSK